MTNFIEKIRKVNKDVWLALFVVLPFFGLIIYSRFAEADKYRGENCYQRVADDIYLKGGDKAFDDVRGVQAQLSTKCD